MKKTLDELTQLIHWINLQGWSPATSTNYSTRDNQDSAKCYVSRSGVDKSMFSHDDFLAMNLQGVIAEDSPKGKPSAETGIHLTLYRETDCNTILHTHSKADTLISRVYADQCQITLRDYELLKGIDGINTHEASLSIPIFANNQDIDVLGQDISSYLKSNATCRAFLIESHGLYTWGTSLAEAKRHLEVCQFLLDCELTLLSINPCSNRA